MTAFQCQIVKLCHIDNHITQYYIYPRLDTGPRLLGLFSSPLEAALIREQILDRQGKLVKKKKAVGVMKNVENFSITQWSMLLELCGLIEEFARE